MCSADTFTESLFTMRKLWDFVPAWHSLREIRMTTNAALVKLKSMLKAIHLAVIKGSRSSVLPEKLPRALLLQVLSSVRSERYSLAAVTRVGAAKS